MQRITSHLFLVAAIIAVLAPAQEPVKPRLTPQIVTATRQVSLFTGLEKQLLQALQKKDKAGVQALVGDDFEIEMPDRDPLPADEWMDSVMAGDFSLKSFVLRQVSVADLGEWAVVKFDRLEQASYKGRNESGEFFVVDLWKQSGDSWKLANRYVAKISSAPPSVTPKPRPTGKE